MTSRTHSTSLEVEARTSKLSDVRAFVSDFAHHVHFSPKEVAEIALAVDEAFTNIIRHAYTSPKEKVTLYLVFDRNHLTISLFDSGKPFAADSSVRPDLSAMVKEKKKGGMGVFLIHKMMDRVEYIHHQNQNEVRMVKIRTS